MEQRSTSEQQHSPFRPTDDVQAEPLLEVMHVDAWVAVGEDIWNSWTGFRRKNCQDHHGPVRTLGTGELYKGARVCGCPTCQSTVAPVYKKN